MADSGCGILAFDGNEILGSRLLIQLDDEFFEILLIFIRNDDVSMIARTEVASP